MLTKYPNATNAFNELETTLYNRIIRESCEYIVDIASQLPVFTEHVYAEVLKREDQLLSIATKVLDDLRQMREELNPMMEAERFELEYRRAVVRNLDVLQLFGADVSSPNRRHRLSVAYVTLLVEQKLPGSSKTGKRVASKEDKSEKEVIVSVESALSSSRCLLIRGLAGSGKTTLLQWIAVRSASRTFEGQLTNWNSFLPFYVRLRHCVRSDIKTKLPAPEIFPSLVAPAIADTMPKGWVHRQLNEGRAIVLIDGLDEVSEFQREAVREWLKELVTEFPSTRFIITSRPHAVEEGWMDKEGFSVAELQPMGVPDIRTFIDHWHDAVCEELADRIELYEACCYMLIERLDKERLIELTDYPSLTYRQKRVLLDDFAYWLTRNGWSEVERQEADDHFNRKLANIPNISSDITGAAVRRLFVERTSIIREPVVNRIDFTHRTFQEFLAAQVASDEGDFGLLVQNAHNDQWREVIILASGLAKKKSNNLLMQIIRRGDEENNHRYLLHLLAVSCLETSVELGQEVKNEMEKRLSTLIPPKSMADATAMASAGELAVPYLSKEKHYVDSTIQMCIRTLALIGTESALDALEGYAYDAKPSVITELWKAWDSFEREEYAQHVLSRALQGAYQVQDKKISSLKGFQFFINLRSLDLAHCTDVSDLGPLADLKQLTSLNISGCTEVSDLGPLAGLKQLTSLNILGCTKVRDLNPLADLRQLTSLDLSNFKLVTDFHFVSNLTQLTSLILHSCNHFKELNLLGNLRQLTTLDLSACILVSDLRPISTLTRLTSLNLGYCNQINDIYPLSKLQQLKTLNLSGCKQITDYYPLTVLKQLIHLSLHDCGEFNHLNHLTPLSELSVLDLSFCKRLSDVSPLSTLKNLVSLNLASCTSITDIGPLESLVNLASLDLSDFVIFTHKQRKTRIEGKPPVSSASLLVFQIPGPTPPLRSGQGAAA